MDMCDNSHPTSEEGSSRAERGRIHEKLNRFSSFYAQKLKSVVIPGYMSYLEYIVYFAVDCDQLSLPWMLFSSSTFERKSVFAASISDVLICFLPIFEPFADRLISLPGILQALAQRRQRAGREVR